MRSTIGFRTPAYPKCRRSLTGPSDSLYMQSNLPHPPRRHPHSLTPKTSAIGFVSQRPASHPPRCRLRDSPEIGFVPPTAQAIVPWALTFSNWLRLGKRHLPPIGFVPQNSPPVVLEASATHWRWTFRCPAHFPFSSGPRYTNTRNNSRINVLDVATGVF